jgi:hypothetical protein
MKTAATFIALAVMFMAVSAFTSNTGPTNGGAKTCKACHSNAKMGGESFKHWEKSPHASAFKTLQTAAADKIAAEKGFKTKAAETPECLSCHVTDKKFAAEGVGCESCHGAGSEYKNKHAKSIEEGVKLGLQLPKVADGSAEKQCKTCHNEKSPTYRPLKFAEAWKKVAHPSGK